MPTIRARSALDRRFFAPYGLVVMGHLAGLIDADDALPRALCQGKAEHSIGIDKPHLRRRKKDAQANALCCRYPMSSLPYPGPTAGILIIGDEILSGKVDDENARFLVQALRALGVSVRRIEVIPDVLEEVSQTVATMAARYDHVFTSGGVGPTHDDVTLPAIAHAFGMAIARRPELAALIRQALGPELHERDLRMADIPVGARLEYGPAGDHGRWPVIAVKNVFVLPGVPSIFRRKFQAISEMFRSANIHSHAVYSREGEGGIAAAMDAVVAEFPTVAVGSYPRIDSGDHKVKITLDGRDKKAVENATSSLVARLGPAVVRQE
jgi:molybdenum cofactor synthesis domain-containing protein